MSSALQELLKRWFDQPPVRDGIKTEWWSGRQSIDVKKVVESERFQQHIEEVRSLAKQPADEKGK